MNFRQIETFAAVMKLGTASAAAELLGVTQPAVSRSIAELEKTLGFALFERVRNRIIPTPEAKLLYRDVQSAFRGIDTIRASAARIRDHGTGEIRVASLSALGSTLVPRAVRIFRETHPGIRVTLLVLPSRDVRNLVASGEFDIGLAADEIDVSGVTYQEFQSRSALCAVPAGHPLASEPVVRPEHFAAEKMIGYIPEDRAQQRFDRILADAGVTPHVVVETLYASTVWSLVAEGVGIGLVSPYSVPPHDPRVVLRPFEPAVLGRSLLILPPDRQKSRLVRAFIDALMRAR